MSTKNKYVYTTLHKQILVMIFLSLFPGIGYIFLGWINDIALPAILWYALIFVISIWGYELYKSFDYIHMSNSDLIIWHKKLSIFFLLIFGSWALIFILYANETESKMHYIAIFTELGASVVAATLLFADKKILRPILLVLMLPLTIYFAFIGEFYSYILSLFSLIFMGVLFYSANSSDKLLERTYYQASHDQLTNIYNRHAFVDALQKKINGLENTGQYSYLLLIDLDHFKTINDSLGHDIGDILLEEVSLRLQNIANKENVIARLGGDEFIFLGKDFSSSQLSLEKAKDISEKLLKSVKSTYKINDHSLYISASIGISILSPRRLSASTFIKEADIAMYEAKSKGRDGVILFNDALSKRVESNLQIEQNLHFAIKNNEIYLHYQPQLNLKKEVIGCEVLVRWNNKELGIVPPDVFIPIAEQTGFIIELGQYILEESLKTLKTWNDQGIVLEQFSINISMRQFFHHSFIIDLGRICQRYLDIGLQKKVIFEMTETLLAEDIKKVISVMKGIRDNLGIRFSLDDFGTGYSSLNYLQQMPISELKIDRSFISELANEKNYQDMVVIILSMAKIFNLKVVAEGVETIEQYHFLEKNSCDIIQGYLYSKPLSEDDFKKYYRDKNHF